MNLSTFPYYVLWMSGILPPEKHDGNRTRTTSPDRVFAWIVSPAEWAASQWILADELLRIMPQATLDLGIEEDLPR